MCGYDWDTSSSLIFNASCDSGEIFKIFTDDDPPSLLLSEFYPGPSDTVLLSQSSIPVTALAQ